MNQRKAPLWILCTALAAAFCCQSPKEPVSMRDESAEARAVAAVLEEVLERFAAGDAEGLLSHYAEDVVVMLPSRREDLDKSATLAYYRELFERMTPSNYTATRDVEVAGDRALARITYRGALRMAGGRGTREGFSRHITVLKRDADGTWRIHWDIFNLPPAPESGLAGENSDAR